MTMSKMRKRETVYSHAQIHTLGCIEPVCFNVTTTKMIQPKVKQKMKSKRKQTIRIIGVFLNVVIAVGRYTQCVPIV